MAGEIGVIPGAVRHAIDRNGLVVALFFEKGHDPNGKTTILPRGAILDRAGRKISSVVLKRDNTPVARCAPGLASPKMGQKFPGHPYGDRCGFRINFDMAQHGARTYSLVVDIEHLGEVEIARPSIYFRRGTLDVGKEKLAHPDIIEEEFWEILPRVWPFAFQETPRLYSLYSALAYVFRSRVPGDFIECGVFMGGCIMLMAEMCKRHDHAGSRRVFALDTFNGFVRVDTKLDVDVRSGKPLGNKVFREFYSKSSDNMRSVGFIGLNIVRGDVLETIPTLDVEKIAVLRLDTDTYDTTKFELEQLHDRVSTGGVVIIDDYGYTHGCRKAVDDFCTDKSIFPQRVDWECRTWVKVGADSRDHAES